MSVMDVQIEPQIQLLSRLQLTIDCQSRLCFLHGESGVGKSYVANLLSGQTNHYCISFSYRENTNAHHVKQQLICELAGDEFSDLEQPLLTAVEQRITHYKHSVTIIIDNASDLPQADIAMLWHAVHDYARQNPSGPHFSVVLVGDTRWAMPLFKALDKKEQSLVAEFELKPLTKPQAREFMLVVHSQWSDGKIDQFLKRFKPQHLLPKQLIYAAAETRDRKSYSKLLLGLAVVVFMVIIALVFAAYLGQPERKPVEQNLEKLDTVAVVITEAESAPEGTDVEKPMDNISKSEERINVAEPILDVEKVEPPQRDIEVTAPVLTTKLVEAVKVEHEVATISPLPFHDESFLLNEPASSYALMLGGYSERRVLERVREKLTSFSDIYQYKTIRNGKYWYVLLYGSFATRAAANDALLALPEHIVGFSPWPKPYTSIHQEIAAFASTNTDNK